MANQQNKYHANGDLLNLMIKLCELPGDQIAYISSYDLQLLIDHQDRLTRGKIKYQIQNSILILCKKLTQNLSNSPTAKIKIIGSSDL